MNPLCGAALSKGEPRGVRRVADFPALMKWLKVVGTMSTTTLIIIIVVLLLVFGGGGGYFYRRGR